jgi:hypothetical protein
VRSLYDYVVKAKAKEKEPVCFALEGNVELAGENLFFLIGTREERSYCVSKERSQNTQARKESEQSCYCFAFEGSVSRTEHPGTHAQRIKS